MLTLTKGVTPEKLAEKRTQRIFGVGLADQLKNNPITLSTDDQLTSNRPKLYKNQKPEIKQALLGG